MLKLKDPGLFKQQAYIAGAWVDADDGKTIAVTNPANGEQLGTVPLSAVCGRAEIMDAPAPGGLGGTYAANALAIASAHAVLDVIEDERLCERAERLGRALRSRLDALRARCAAISDVRGLGSMVAVEFAAADGTPDADYTRRVQKRAQDAGLLLLTCGVYGNVIRFLFPLTIEDAVFDEGLAILAQALES